MNEVPPTNPVRILLADDHQIFRDGLKLLLQCSMNLQLVGELDNLSMLRTEVAALQPDLLLLDYHMPGGDTSAQIQYLKQRYPTLRILVLTGSQSPLLLQQVLQAQADGVLLKNGDAAELHHAIAVLLQQKSYISPAVSALLPQAELALTSREYQILQLICQGLTNAQIAVQLNLSPKTTDKHREHLMRKLDAGNAAQLILKALQLGLLDHP